MLARRQLPYTPLANEDELARRQLRRDLLQEQGRNEDPILIATQSTHVPGHRESRRVTVEDVEDEADPDIFIFTPTPPIPTPTPTPTPPNPTPIPVDTEVMEAPGKNAIPSAEDADKQSDTEEGPHVKTEQIEESVCEGLVPTRLQTPTPLPKITGGFQPAPISPPSQPFYPTIPPWNLSPTPASPPTPSMDGPPTQ